MGIRIYAVEGNTKKYIGTTENQNQTNRIIATYIKNHGLSFVRESDIWFQIGPDSAHHKMTWRDFPTVEGSGLENIELEVTFSDEFISHKCFTGNTTEYARESMKSWATEEDVKTVRLIIDGKLVDEFRRLA